MSVPRIVKTIANSRPAFVWPSAAYRVSSVVCRSAEVTKTGLLKNGCSLSVRATRRSSQFFSEFPASHSKLLQWARASGNAAINVYYLYIHACQGRPSVLLMPNVGAYPPALTATSAPTAPARGYASLSLPPALRLPVPMHDSENHDLVRQDAEEHTVRKPLNNRAARGAMNHGKRQWSFKDGRNGQVHLEGELLAKSGLLLIVPMPRFEKLGFRLRPKDQPARHGRFSSFRRTSSQGSALLGSARCSSSRRSNSAACSGVRANSAPRWASSRLAQSAMARSALSPEGNFNRSVRVSGIMRSSCHAPRLSASR